MVLLSVSLLVSLCGVSCGVVCAVFARGVAISWVSWLSLRTWYIPGICFAE